MEENYQLVFLADLIELYEARFQNRPPAPPFVPLAALISAYERATEMSKPIEPDWMPGAV